MTNEGELPVWCDEDDLSPLKARLISDDHASHLAAMFGALSDPNRVRLISLLRTGEVCVHVLSETLGMSQSAVSHQLRGLRQLGLVRTRKIGRRVYYTLDDSHVSTLFEQGLAHVQHTGADDDS